MDHTVFGAAKGDPHLMGQGVSSVDAFQSR